MKKLIIPLVMAGSFFISLISCYDHSEEPAPPVDQLTGYERIEATNTVVPELADFYNYSHFVIDSTIYLITKWVHIHDIELVAIDFEGHLKTRTTFYTSEYELGVHPEYDPVKDVFYITGEIYDESPFPYASGLFLVVDRNGILHHEKEYHLEGKHNGIYRTVLRPGNMPLLLTWVSGASMGSLTMKDETLILLDNNYDSLTGFHLPFENSYYDYMEVTQGDIIKMIGVQYDSADLMIGYTHRFYAELSMTGDILANYRLDGINTGEIYIEPSDPLNYYAWVDNKKGINWNKYSQDGSLSLSTDYDIFKVKYPKYDYSLTFQKDPFSEKNILYGGFATGGGYESPLNHGTYIIKCDDYGNDDYKVAFNTGPEGFFQITGMSVLSQNSYLILYDYYSQNNSKQFILTRVNIE